MAKFVAGQQEAVRRLQDRLAELEKNALVGGNRTGRSAINSGTDSIKYDPKDGSDPLQGSRGVVPSQYSDAYRQFTQQASGVKK
jgi:hypothetical protein